MKTRTALVAALSVAAIAPGAADAAGPHTPSATPAEIRQAVADAIARGEKPRKLRRATPAWFTRKVRRRLARDRNGVIRAPVDAPLPGEVGIRPGSWMVAPYLCTMNFIFRKSATVAIGTAGHCLDGSQVTLLTLAPGSGNPVLVDLGRVLLRRDGGIGKDYGLVEVPPALHKWVFHTTPVWGGPCSVYSANKPTAVTHYGHGLVGGTGGTPKAGMGFSLARDPGLVKGVDWDWDADSIVWAGYLYGGDSGSPVQVAGLGALADLTHGIGITGLEPSAIGWGTRVTTITGSGWQLQRSPICI